MKRSLRTPLLLISLLLAFMLFIIYGIPGGEKPVASAPVVHEILGAEESCVQCHGKVEGFSPAHNPEVIGCSPCHGGDPTLALKEEAHRNLILVPGNLVDMYQTCGAANCHLNIAERVDHSLMATMSGVVSVDKFVFGEIDAPEGFFHIGEIGQTAADSHLRHLCASCHLGNEKEHPGPITQMSRGGGCNACHLNYATEALRELQDYEQDPNHILKAHPALSLQVSNDHCFGCHSRSSRISLNYEGWHETQLEAEAIDPDDNRFRILEDGRVVEYIQADVHHQAGLDCIDCHHAQELMGDGELYEHKESALKVHCEDCHRAQFDNTLRYEELDTESKKLLALRGVDGDGKRFLQTDSEVALINAWLDSLDQAKLQGKNSGRSYVLTAPAEICTRQGGHAGLTCNACHTGWAPQCIGCHNTFEPNTPGFDLLSGESGPGRWIEHIGVFFHDQPALGIVESTGLDEQAIEEIKTFIPGMVLSIDADSFYRADRPERFHRLYAPTAAHTIRSVGRSCKSCHNNPLALGYGRGEFKYNIRGDRGYWTFEAEYADNPQDGLPQDAWIGFLEESDRQATTRTFARPFSRAAQIRMLTVGSCLTCHREDDPIMLEGIENFQDILYRRSPSCVLPEFR